MSDISRNSKDNFAKLLTGAAIGFYFFELISQPDSRVKRKMPEKKIKNLHVSPNIRLVRKNRIYHFHHWLIFASFYLPIIISRKKILKYKILHGFIIGSIIQGLTFKDRFRMIYHHPKT